MKGLKDMSEYTLRSVTPDEYKERMQKLLDEKGLHDAVEKYADRINSLSSVLSYVPHREVQECLCDIIFLIDLAEGKNADLN